MSDPEDVVLDVEDLQKAFGSVIAARDINLKFARNETVGIIGANGAGKTTFVNLVTGYLAPSSGRIRYLGRDITRMAPRRVTRSGLSRSFQIPQFFPNMTTYENVLMAFGIAEASWLPALGLHNTLRRQRQVDEILTHYKIEGYRDQEVALLPQGIRKLVDVAMATAGNPKILLLDEPTSGISAEEKYGLMDVIMDALRDRDVTVLFIEHDMDVVSRYAERVIAFYAGGVIADGPPSTVLGDAQVKEYVIGTHLEQHHHKTGATASAAPREA